MLACLVMWHVAFGFHDIKALTLQATLISQHQVSPTKIPSKESGPVEAGFLFTCIALGFCWFPQHAVTRWWTIWIICYSRSFKSSPVSCVYWPQSLQTWDSLTTLSGDKAIHIIPYTVRSPILGHSSAGFPKLCATKEAEACHKNFLCFSFDLFYSK